MAAARRARRRARPARGAAARRSTRSCRTRTTASTTCSIPTTTTSSRAGSRRRSRRCAARAPRVYHNDHSRPERPVIRALDEEIAPRRARPRRQPEMDRRRDAPRLQGRLRDRGDGRLSLRLRRDDRTRSGTIISTQLYDAYLGDDDGARLHRREQSRRRSREMAARFCEAIDRGLWAPRAQQRL